MSPSKSYTIPQELLAVEREDQLSQLPADMLLAFYNHKTGRTTTKFDARAKGEARVWKLLQEDIRSRTEVEKPVKKGVRRKTFRLCPKPQSEQKAIRAGTKRRILFDMTSQPGGALFSELQKMCNWSSKDNYEGLRLLHVWCGYGLWSEEEDDDYRIWLCRTVEDWRSRAKSKSNCKQQGED